MRNRELRSRQKAVTAVMSIVHGVRARRQARCPTQLGSSLRDRWFIAKNTANSGKIADSAYSGSVWDTRAAKWNKRALPGTMRLYARRLPQRRERSRSLGARAAHPVVGPPAGGVDRWNGRKSDRGGKIELGRRPLPPHAIDLKNTLSRPRIFCWAIFSGLALTQPCAAYLFFRLRAGGEARRTRARASGQM